MGFQDCGKCWDRQCTCGYMYKDYTPSDLSHLIASMVGYRPDIEATLILEGAVMIRHLDKVKEEVDKSTKK